MRVLDVQRVCREGDAVDGIHLGVDRADVVVAGGHIHGQRRRDLALHQGVAVGGGHERVARLRRCGVVCPAEIEADAVQLMQVLAVKAEGKVAACGAARDRRELRRLRHIVEHKLRRRRRGNIKGLVKLRLVGHRKGERRAPGALVIGEVCIGGGEVILLHVAAVEDEREVVCPRRGAHGDAVGKRLCLCRVRCRESHLHDACAVVISAEVERMRRLVGI